MEEATAETLALRALGYLAGSEDDLACFFAVSGLGSGELRARAGDPELLVAVLDHFLANEKLIAAFCGDESVDSRDLHAARFRLGGR